MGEQGADRCRLAHGPCLKQLACGVVVDRGRLERRLDRLAAQVDQLLQLRSLGLCGRDQVTFARQLSVAQRRRRPQELLHVGAVDVDEIVCHGCGCGRLAQSFHLLCLLSLPGFSQLAFRLVALLRELLQRVRRRGGR